MNEAKKILVTGASGGIGRAIAVACAAAGYYVVAHYNRSRKKAEETLAAMQAAGGCGELVQFDISDREGCRRELDSLSEKHGTFWGLVSNAGVNRDNTFVGLSGEDWDSVVHTNLDSFFNVLQPLVMPMCRKKQGRIVTISSVSGIAGNRGQTNYSASKAGIIGATKALAVELASRGITVNAVAPGIIETDMTKDFDPELIKQLVPMRRSGTPEEVAAAVVFLLSEQAAYITRQVISINGGMV